jgi:3-methyladenine DNA glycosylase AlkD
MGRSAVKAPAKKTLLKKAVVKKASAKKSVEKKSAAAPDVEAVLKALEKAGSKKFRDEMGPRYGLFVERAWGTPMAQIKAIAKPIGKDHALAQKLWESGWYEARLLASIVDDPALVTPAQMDRWRREFDNWGVTDTVCFNLFDRTPHALAKVHHWAKLNDEFGRRAAFALLACVSLHRSKMSDAELLDCLPLIEAVSTDARNFVKKGVNWALRAMGGRNLKLNAACIKLARKLAAAEDATARWVGKDALRALTGDAMKKRLNRRARGAVGG